MKTLCDSIKEIQEDEFLSLYRDYYREGEKDSCFITTEQKRNEKEKIFIEFNIDSNSSVVESSKNEGLIWEFFQDKDKFICRKQYIF